MSGASAVVRVPIVAVTDPRNARILLFVAYSLFAIGLAMLCATVYWWRRARVDHPALARLEQMPAPRRADAPRPESPPKQADPTAGAGNADAEPTEAAPAPLSVGEPVSRIDPLLRPEEPNPDEAVTSG